MKQIANRWIHIATFEMNCMNTLGIFFYTISRFEFFLYLEKK